jgi:hypothetical protein
MSSIDCGLGGETTDALSADGAEKVVWVLPGMDVPRNQVILLVVGEMAFFFSVINEFHNVVKGQAEFLFNAALRGALFINVKSLRPERFAQPDGQGLERPQSALTPPSAECDRIASHLRPAGSNSLVVAGLLRQL